MKTHIVVNNTDLTPYIVDGSYDVNASDTYESWQDGNFKEHRVIVASKVSGSFQIACGGGLTLSAFLGIWDGAVDNGVLTIGLYVPNKDTFGVYECYFEMENKDHILTAGGRWVDVFNIKIQER